MKGYKIHFVDDGTLLAKALRNEQENYRWKKINDMATNQPEDKYNHLMDSIRYSLMLVKQKRSAFW
jgi:hypothetical protein